MTHCHCTACQLLDRFFLRYETGRHEFIVPFKRNFQRVWFVIPRYLHYKNWEGIQYSVQPDGTRSKPKPFWGIVFEKTEGELTPYAWWKLIKFVKHERGTEIKSR